MSIYDKITKNKTIINTYKKYVKQRKERLMKKRVKGKYIFESRKKDSKYLCIILAGYKEFLYSDVFSRVKEYVPKEFDICIISSGLYSDKLSKIAKKNKWSYLSIKKNKVTLAQNIAINVFEKAEYILKIDEDIFLTKNTVREMMKTYNEVENNTSYNIGFSAPLLPINGYAHARVLDLLGLKKDFEKKFGKVKHTWDPEYKIIKNPEIAKYMWGENNNVLNDYDSIDLKLSKKQFCFSISPVRFSIGCIYFSRKLWNDMGRFIVKPGTNMGVDEIQICDYVFKSSKVIAVSENTIAGHFSYGPQTIEMKKYYNNNKNIFKIKK